MNASKMLPGRTKFVSYGYTAEELKSMSDVDQVQHGLDILKEALDTFPESARMLKAEVLRLAMIYTVGAGILLGQRDAKSDG